MLNRKEKAKPWVIVKTKCPCCNCTSEQRLVTFEESMLYRGLSAKYITQSYECQSTKRLWQSKNMTFDEMDDRRRAAKSIDRFLNLGE